MLGRGVGEGWGEASGRGLKYDEKCTAVQINFDCGVAIGAPQSKFCWTAVRFLPLFRRLFEVKLTRNRLIVEILTNINRMG